MTTRLLQIAKHFHPDRGGIETVTLNLSEGLVAHDILADVLCLEYEGPYSPLNREYQVFRTKSDFGYGNKRISFDYIRKIGELQDNYDIALVHMPNPLAVLGVLRYWRKPFLLLWHADIPQTAIRAATTMMDRALARRADAIIGPTPVHLRESHHAVALQENGLSIAYPYDPNRIPEPTQKSDIAKEVRAFANGRKISLSTGRLVPYKGFDKLIEAATDFDPDLVAVIVGSGPLHDELQSKIENQGVADRIFLTGSIDDNGLSDLLDMAYFGCMPSVTAAEMYGVAQVEVMSCGKPVVSTRLQRSGVSYVNRHDDTGIVVEPGDVKELAHAMNSLVRDEELYNRLASGAARSYETDHALGPVTAKYADLVDNVLGKRRAA